MAADSDIATLSDTPHDRDTAIEPSLSPAIPAHDQRTRPRPASGFHFLLEQRP